MHAVCARCDFPFDGSVDPQPMGDAGTASHDQLTGEVTRPQHDMTPTGTPTGTPSTTPTGPTPTTDPPEPAPPEPPPRAAAKASVPLAKKRDPLSVTDVSADNNPDALPRGPSWNLPGRNEETGGSWSKESGLPRAAATSRGSLTARQRAAKAAAVVEEVERPKTDESIQAVAHPSRPRAPAPLPSSNPGRATSQPGGHAGDLRGRPPGKLYASENSIPPGDPLMAALVSGDALLADSIPDINLTGEGQDSGDHLPVFDELPPADDDYNAAADTRPDPPPPADNRPRVVPPSTGRRSTSGSRRRRSVAGASVPGRPAPSRPAASLPAAPRPSASRPGQPAPPDVGMDVIVSDPRVQSIPPMDPRSTRTAPRVATLPPLGRRDSRTDPRVATLPPVGRRDSRTDPAVSTISRDSRGASIPPRPRGASVPGQALQHPQGSFPPTPPPRIDDMPLPPPVNIPEAPPNPKDKERVRLGIRIALAVVAIGLALLAVRDVSGMVADLAGLRAAVNENIRSDGLPTPDLPQVLDHRIRELDLKKRIVGRWATISAKADQFSVGVEVEHKIVGVPRRTKVSREGRFAVSEQLKTLEFYLEDWELDDEGKVLLEDSRSRRDRR